MIEDLVSCYTTAAIEHGESIASNDYNRANQAADTLVKCVMDMRAELGNVLPLKSLLYHSHPHVRAWAATHCLPYAEEEAKAVLRDLALEQGILGFGATMTLREWEKGTLSLP